MAAELGIEASKSGDAAPAAGEIQVVCVPKGYRARADVERGAAEHGAREVASECSIPLA